VGAGKCWGKGVERCKNCVCMYVNAKIIPVKTILGRGEGEIKESGGQG
jgi:hypothetical protein